MMEPGDPVSLPRLAPHERELIAVARAVVGLGTFAAIEPTLGRAVPIDKPSPSAMNVLMDTLRKGVVKTLARLGGAQQRVFATRPTPVLAFGRYSFELLRWLTATPLEHASFSALVVRPQTLGDEVLAYLVLRLVAASRLERAVAKQAALQHTSLAWLGHTRALARVTQPAGHAPPAWSAVLAHEDARTVIECLSGDLAEQWTRASRVADGPVTDVAEAHRVVLAENATLDGFLAAVAALGRWELATFLVVAGARLLAPRAEPRDVALRAMTPVLATGPLRARAEVRRHSGAVFHALAQLGAQHERLALVRFFDDGYDDAQARLTSWSVLGREGFARAEDVVRVLTALDAPPSRVAPDAPATTDDAKKKT